MFLSLFKGYRQARVQAIKASLPDCIILGEGDWCLFEKTPLGIPCLRLARSRAELSGYSTTPKLLYDSEIPRIPEYIGAWLPRSVVHREGPFVVGHLYRRHVFFGLDENYRKNDLRTVIVECVKDPNADDVIFRVIKDESSATTANEESLHSKKQNVVGTYIDNPYGKYFDFDSTKIEYMGPATQSE